jgi:hypothetical protein
MKDRFILACQEYFVKRRAEAQAAGQPVCAHPRFRRETLPEEDISRRLKRLGRRIVRSEGLNKPAERGRVGASAPLSGDRQRSCVMTTAPQGAVFNPLLALTGIEPLNASRISLG